MNNTSIPRKPTYSKPQAQPQTDGTSALKVSVAQDATRNPLLDTVYNLSAMRCNVFPLAYMEKTAVKSLEWGKVTRSFNAWHMHKDMAERLFVGLFNIAVATGQTSNNLIVIDIDDQQTFNYAVATCIQTFKHIFAVKTRRGGHIYLRCTNGSIPSQNFHKQHIEIKSDGRYVVGLGSEYYDPETGLNHEYTAHKRNTGIPTATPQEIQAYIKTFKVDVSIAIKGQRKSENTKSDAYDAETRDYLANGHGYKVGSRNNAMIHACRVMLAHGDDSDHVFNTLYPIAIASGLSDKEATASLTNTIQKFDVSKMRGGKQLFSDSNHKLAKTFYEYHNWDTKPTNFTTRAVMNACLIMSRREYAKPEFRVAIREIAELAHVPKSTADRHLKILSAIGIITLTTKTTGTRYAQWRRDELIQRTKALTPYGCYATRGVSSDNHKTVENGTVVRSTILEDTTVPKKTVFTKDQLELLQDRTALSGKTLVLYVQLLQHKKPLKLGQITEITGFATESARYQLNKLIAKKLAVKESRYYHAVNNDVEILAMLQRARSADENRKLQHREEQFKRRCDIIYTARYRFDKFFKRLPEPTQDDSTSPQETIYSDSTIEHAQVEFVLADDPVYQLFGDNSKRTLADIPL